MAVNEIKDMFGQVVTVGDIIAYPVRQGSSMSMKVGVVTKLHYEPRTEWSNDDKWADIITIVDGAWDTLTKQCMPKEKKTQFFSFSRAIVINKDMLVDQWKTFAESKKQFWQQRIVNLQERVRSE